MNYFQLTYTVADNGDRVYPKRFAKIVCRVTQDHASDKTMIFGTDDDLKADGKSIIALTEEQALKMMQDYQQAFPKAPTLVPAGLPGQPGLPMPFPPPPSR